MSLGVCTLHQGRQSWCAKSSREWRVERVPRVRAAQRITQLQALVYAWRFDLIELGCCSGTYSPERDYGRDHVA